MAGLNLAFAHHQTVSIGADQTVGVANPAVVTVLKMAAYLDRPVDRTRDLEDLACLLAEYVAPADARRFDPEIITLGLDFDASGSYLLGCDVGSVCDGPAAGLVRAFLERTKSPVAPAHLELLLQAGPRVRADLPKILWAFEMGFLRSRSRDGG